MNTIIAPTPTAEKTRFKSKKLGIINYEKDEIIHFTYGLLGFPYLKSFLLLNNKETPLFMFLQSLEKDFTFILSSGILLLKNYQVLTHDTKEKKDDGEIVFNIVTVSNVGREISINLLGPVLLDPQKKTGRQIVLADEEYSTKHKINNKELAMLVNEKQSLLNFIRQIKN